MDKKTAIAMVSSIVTLTLTTQVYAQQPQPSGWGAGLAVISQQEGYRDADSETLVIPVAFYEGESFYWRGPELGYNLSEKITLFAEYRFDGFEPDDSDFFAGMEERKGTLDIGFSYGLEVAGGELEFSASADALGEHEGYEFGLSFGMGFPALGGLITPFVQASYLSQNLVDYYYGVRAAESTLLRPFYEGDNTINYGVGISGFWSLTQNQNIIASLNYDVLGSEIENSPLIEDSESSSLFVAWIYNF